MREADGDQLKIKARTDAPSLSEPPGAGMKYNGPPSPGFREAKAREVSIWEPYTGKVDTTAQLRDAEIPFEISALYGGRPEPGVAMKEQVSRVTRNHQDQEPGATEFQCDLYKAIRRGMDAKMTISEANQRACDERGLGFTEQEIDESTRRSLERTRGLANSDPVSAPRMTLPGREYDQISPKLEDPER
jgi:hypothetical protein